MNKKKKCSCPLSRQIVQCRKDPEALASIFQASEQTTPDECKKVSYTTHHTSISFFLFREVDGKLLLLWLFGRHPSTHGSSMSHSKTHDVYARQYCKDTTRLFGASQVVARTDDPLIMAQQYQSFSRIIRTKMREQDRSTARGNPSCHYDDRRDLLLLCPRPHSPSPASCCAIHPRINTTNRPLSASESRYH